MKDLNAILREIKDDFKALDLWYGKVVSITYNARLRKCWGRCHRIGNIYKIEITTKLGEDSSPDIAIKTTVAHELLHTVKGCFAHNKKFLSIGRLLYSAYGYNVKTTNTPDELGMTKTYKYKIACCTCNQIIAGADKQTKMVASIMAGNASKYYCRKCKGSDLKCFFAINTCN